MTTFNSLTETASDFGKGARESIEELGRSAGRKLDGAREETGEALHSAASSVRSTGRRSSEAIDGLATGVADRLDATATYVEDHDLRRALDGLWRFGRKHPAGSLMAAAAVGFIAGSAFNRVSRLCARVR